MRFKIPVQDCFLTNFFNEPANYPFAPKRKQLHEGIDYAPALKDARAEIPVYAAHQGTVVKVGWDARGYGNFVVVRHDSRFLSWYCHLEQPSKLKYGDQIDLETLIGIMGSTGNSTGRHLHFTVQDMIEGLDNYVVAKVIDPQPLMVDEIATLQMPIKVYNILSNITPLGD